MNEIKNQNSQNTEPMVTPDPSTEVQLIDHIGELTVQASKASDKEALVQANQASRIPSEDLRQATPLPSDTFSVYETDGGGLMGFSKYTRPPLAEWQHMHLLGPGQSVSVTKHPTLAIFKPKNKVISNRDGKLYVNGHRKPLPIARLGNPVGMK